MLKLLSLQTECVLWTYLDKTTCSYIPILLQAVW